MKSVLGASFESVCITGTTPYIICTVSSHHAVHVTDGPGFLTREPGFFSIKLRGAVYARSR